MAVGRERGTARGACETILYLRFALVNDRFLMAGRRETGRYERVRHGEEEVAAFIPHQLPPKAPPLVLDEEARGFTFVCETWWTWN